jgi:hypothetical protein
MSLHTFEGEDGKQFNFTIAGEDGFPLNLTGGSVSLLWAVPGAGVQTRNCPLISAPAGTCRYTTAAADWVRGLYRAQLKVTLPSAPAIYSPIFKIKVSATVESP